MNKRNLKLRNSIGINKILDRDTPDQRKVHVAIVYSSDRTNDRGVSKSNQDKLTKHMEKIAELSKKIKALQIEVGYANGTYNALCRTSIQMDDNILYLEGDSFSGDAMLSTCQAALDWMYNRVEDGKEFTSDYVASLLKGSHY